MGKPSKLEIGDDLNCRLKHAGVDVEILRLLLTQDHCRIRITEKAIISMQHFLQLIDVESIVIQITQCFYWG